jgi:hypothetical protein
MSANAQLPIHAFAKLAREFCDWCESESLGPRANRMAASWLALLYAAALEIPEVELENYDTELEPAIEEAPQVKRNFAGFWGQNYRQIFDPRLDGDELPVVGDLGLEILEMTCQAYTPISRAPSSCTTAAACLRLLGSGALTTRPTGVIMQSVPCSEFITCRSLGSAEDVA